MADKLYKIVISSFKWTASSKIAITLLQVSQLLILTRILTPSDFGIMSLVLVVIGICNILSDGGISKMLIINDKFDDEQLSTLYWINILLGVFFALVVYFSSSLISSFYGNEGLSRPLSFISVSLIIIA
ncbi:oligosaccharide flippase family protein, partial [Shewanella indica]|uniref:oligosaccharide flippase family protein n=1 Tax=Shewanella indica TaxID=768528 RepID=UPI001F338709